MPGQRDTAPSGYQRLSSLLSLNRDLQSYTRALVCLDGGLVGAINLADTDAELMRQGLHARSFHDPFQPVEGVEVIGQPVVFHEPPIFLLILDHDTEGGIVEQFCSMNRFAVSQLV